MHISFAVRPGLFFRATFAGFGWYAARCLLGWLRVPHDPGGVSLWGPSSTGTSSYGVGLRPKVSTRVGAPCRRRCIVCLSVLRDGPCARTRLKPLSVFFCLETGVSWRYELNDRARSRFCDSSGSVGCEDDFSINVLELLGMVVSAWVLVVLCAERPLARGDCVLLRGDNEAAVQWVRRGRGGLEPRSGALMRLLGVLEVSLSLIHI